MDLTEISKDIEMEIIARVVEIGIRALFENFTITNLVEISNIKKKGDQ